MIPEMSEAQSRTIKAGLLVIVVAYGLLIGFPINHADYKNALSIITTAGTKVCYPVFEENQLLCV